MRSSILIALGLLILADPGLNLAQDFSPKKLSLAELIQEAIERNPEVREVQNRAEAASYRTSQARSPFLPEIGAKGGYESWQSSQAPDNNLRGGFAYIFGRYNLYRGSQDRYRLRARSKEEEFANYALDQVKAKISRGIASQFYQLIYLDEAIKLKEEALELNRSQISKAEKRVRSGLVSKADILEFELREASLRSDLVLLKQEREVAERELRRILGRTDESPIAVQGNLSAGSAPGVRKEELLNTALSQRPDLREAEKDYEIASLEYATTLSEWLPQVNLEGNFGNLQPSEREVQGTPSSAVILKVTLPLFSGLSSYYERKAKSADRAQADSRIVRLKLETKTQVEIARTRMQAIQERLELETKNVARAQEYYEMTLSEYGRGVKNSPDLAGATERLYGSKERLLDFQKDYHLARLNLAERIGAGADFLCFLLRISFVFHSKDTSPLGVAPE